MSEIAEERRSGTSPDDWVCPVCGAAKTDFEPFEG
ncbi:rubredoxin [Pseudonocardia sp. EC080625-04]|nr:rubredoxin [Pseudonocardia sp. EC080625-04]